MRAILCLLLFSTSAGGQWLPDQATNRKLWESTGVPFPDGMRFYEMPVVSQRLVTVDSVDRHGIYSGSHEGKANVNVQLPWAVPAGLHESPKEQWRTVRAARLGEISIYRERVQVLNSFGDRQPQTRMAWKYSDGTMFAEMLIRRHSGVEWPFEIRVREKRRGKWSGTAYRPFVSTDQLPPGSVQKEHAIAPGRLRDFGLGESVASVWELPKGSLFIPQWGKFAPSLLTVTASDDDSAVPRSYLGTVGRRCAECHDKAGESTSYGSVTIRGSDTVFSWHPFSTDTINTDAPPRVDTARLVAAYTPIESRVSQDSPSLINSERRGQHPDPQLLLTGSAVRSVTRGPFTVQVYEVKSYATGPLLADVPKRLELTFLRSVSGSDMASAFEWAFRQSNPTGTVSELADLLRLIRSSSMQRGSVLTITSIPGEGLDVAAPGQRLRIPGPEFSRAVWSIFFGPSPISESMKRNLGGNR